MISASFPPMLCSRKARVPAASVRLSSIRFSSNENLSIIDCFFISKRLISSFTSRLRLDDEPSESCESPQFNIFVISLAIVFFCISLSSICLFNISSSRFLTAIFSFSSRNSFKRFSISFRSVSKHSRFFCQSLLFDFNRSNSLVKLSKVCVFLLAGKSFSNPSTLLFKYSNLPDSFEISCSISRDSFSSFSNRFSSF